MTKNKVTRYVTKHSPEIFTGIGIAGLIGTAIFAAKAQPKALALIEKAEAEKQEPLTFGEKVKITWKVYVPAVTTGITSIAFLLGANAVHVKRNAAIATACKLSEVALTEYKNKVVETLGEEKDKEIREAIRKDHVESNPIVVENVITTKKGGNTHCLDYSSGRWFMSDRVQIEKAVNKLNEKLTHDMFVSLNDFYDELGLDRTSIGEVLGWDIMKGIVELQFDTCLDTEGNPCLVVAFENMPYSDYDRIS